MNITDRDIERWRAEGHSEALIQRWITNLSKHETQLAEGVRQIMDRYNRIRGNALGTPLDGATVIEQESDCPDCPRCFNRRFIQIGDQMQPCPDCRGATVDRWRVEALAKYSAANGRASEQTLDNFQPNAHTLTAHHAARTFAANPQGWLVIYGTPGTGKSHLCAAIANELLDRNQAAIFVTMPQLVSSLKRLWNSETATAEGETYDERKDVYATTPVLIVDDIAAGTTGRRDEISDYDERILFDILDPRYTNTLPTVLVSNLNLTDPSTFDPRLVRRWTEHGFATVVHVAGPVYAREAAA